MMASKWLKKVMYYVKTVGKCNFLENKRLLNHVDNVIILTFL